MSINIKIPDQTFNFSELSLGEPSAILNGFYYSRIQHGDDLYIQTPEIISKSGFVNTTNKNYIDLIFNNNNELILEWFENLENRIKILIYEKRAEWFTESNVEMSDIENIFISPIRSYKSGKQFVLRANIESAKNSFINVDNIKIYDSNHNEINKDNINNSTKFIALIKISGIKFSSRTFQIYIEIKQIMLVDDKQNSIFSKCLITPTKDKKVTPSIALEIDKQTDKQNDTNNNDDNYDNHDNDDNNDNNNQKIILETKEIETNKVEDTENLNDITETNEIADTISDDTIGVDTIGAGAADTGVDTIGAAAADTGVDTIGAGAADTTVDTTVDDTIGTDTINVDEIQVTNKEFIENINNLNNDEAEEVNVNLDNLEKSNIVLQDPTDEHIELYREALKKAKELRKQALQSHLEAQNIKAKYLLNVYSDSESDSDYIDSENEESNNI